METLISNKIYNWKFWGQLTGCIQIEICPFATLTFVALVLRIQYIQIIGLMNKLIVHWFSCTPTSNYEAMSNHDFLTVSQYLLVNIFYQIHDFEDEFLLQKLFSNELIHLATHGGF